MLFGFALPQKLYASPAKLWGDLLPHLSFTHNLFYSASTDTKLNGALWTLAVEVQFYLLFPLLARAFTKKPALSYVCMAAFSLLVRYRLCLWEEDVSLYFNRLSAMLDVYANGMLAANLYFQLNKKPDKPWRAWLSTALTVCACIGICRIFSRQAYSPTMTQLHRGQMTWRFLLSLLGSVFLVCGSRSIRLMRLLFSNPVTGFLSEISFNYYIWHQFLAVRLRRWYIPPYTGDGSLAEGQMSWQRPYTLSCVCAALLTAILVTYLVERPCARLIKRKYLRVQNAPGQP